MVSVCQQEVPVITTCPPAGSKVLLFDVSDQPTGMALIGVDVLTCCIINRMFGVGTITIKGSDLVNGLYYNSRFVQNLQVFAWNIPNYLIREGQNGLDTDLGQWRYILSSGSVVGIEIYGVGFLDDDLFTISPSVACDSLPVSSLVQGLQFSQISFDGDGETLVFTIPHGLGGTPYFDVQPVGADSSGEFVPTADSTNIYVTYNVAPPEGTANVVFNWAANLPAS